MHNGPRIGITSGLASQTWAADGSAWLPYAEAVRAAGGTAVHLGAHTCGRETAAMVELDGLVLTGGKDLHLDSYPNPPSLNGSTVEEIMERHRMRPEPIRDAYELALLSEALDRDLPVLGICRGCQVLNVGLGGRLILDIESDSQRVRHNSYPPPDGSSSRHALDIKPGSVLAGALQPEGVRVCNSRHHQAVLVDDAFTAAVVAVSPEDGLVEAIEVPGRRWVVGVQWHPEHAADHDIRELHSPLFRAFIEAARIS
jgi:gamma-glutamyl-gamma-aminobutyrate hydrolase PuuD